MVARNDNKIMERMYKIIVNHGKIRRLDLIDKADISIDKYQHIKAYLEERYENMIKYNHETKYWEAPEVLIKMEIDEENKENQSKLFEEL